MHALLSSVLPLRCRTVAASMMANFRTRQSAVSICAVLGHGNDSVEFSVVSKSSKRRTTYPQINRLIGFVRKLMKGISKFCCLAWLFYYANAMAIPTVPEMPDFPAVVSNGEIYYVDNTPGAGDDHLNNGSQVQPWASLKKAVRQISAGDTVLVQGTSVPYGDEWVQISISGTDTQWITIRGVDGPAGEKAIFTHRMHIGDTVGGSASYIYLDNIHYQGPGASGYNMVLYPNSHHIFYQNIEIDCQGSLQNERGIWTNEDVHHLWFKDVYVHHCGYSRVDPHDCGGICVKAPNIDDVVFLNVTTSHNVGDGLGSGSAIRYGYGDFYFKQCLSENNTGDGYDMNGNQVVFVDSISKNNGGHQGVGFKFWSKDSWLVRSVAFNNDATGVSIKPRRGGVNSAYILNNTLAENNAGIYGGQIGTTSHLPPVDGSLELYIYNNIIHAAETSGVVISNDKNQVIREEGNNYYFSFHDETLIPAPHWAYVDAIQFRDGDLNVTASYSFSDVADGGLWSILNPGLGVGNVGETNISLGKSNPGFVDLAAGDPHLLAGSLAIDAGTDLGFDSDLEGMPVPLGAAPGIGAYEFANGDHDGDGVSDGQEVVQGTDPHHADTDRDGLTDGDPQEINPLSIFSPHANGWNISVAGDFSDVQVAGHPIDVQAGGNVHVMVWSADIDMENLNPGSTYLQINRKKNAKSNRKRNAKLVKGSWVCDAGKKTCNGSLGVTGLVPGTTYTLGGRVKEKNTTGGSSVAIPRTASILIVQ
jgi:hypothetical protein